jgi:DNA polymerase-3 subunit beta
MTSSDGHRLTLIERPVEGLEQLDLGRGILVPLKGAKEIPRLLADGGADGLIEVSLSDKALALRVRDRVLYLRLMDKRFPEYRRIIPDGFQSAFTFNRQELVAVLKRLSLLSTGAFRRLIFTITEDAATVAHDNPEVGTGREVLGVTSDNGDVIDPLTIGFNARYLLEPLQVMTSDTIFLEINDRDHPCRIMEPGDAHYFSLIMPMSL